MYSKKRKKRKGECCLSDISLTNAFNQYIRKQIREKASYIYIKVDSRYLDRHVEFD